MIRTLVRKETLEGLFYFEYAGLSTDSKATGAPISTGSLFLEVNTGDVYAYDEASSSWKKVCALGGSGS